MELADSIREIAAGHILPDSPLGKALDRIAGAVDQLEARVRAQELLCGRKITDLNGFEREQLERCKHVVDPPAPGLFERTERPE